MESLTSKPGIREQYRPICDIGRAQRAPATSKRAILPFGSVVAVFADGDFVSGGIADAHGQSIFNRAKNLVVSA